MSNDDAIDMGRFEWMPVGVSTGEVYWRGTTDFAEELPYDWRWRHKEGKTCPGPGYGEPECGVPIEDGSERCMACLGVRRMIESGRAVQDAIREPPKVTWEERILAELRERRKGKAR